MGRFSFFGNKHFKIIVGVALLLTIVASVIVLQIFQNVVTKPSLALSKVEQIKKGNSNYMTNNNKATAKKVLLDNNCQTPNDNFCNATSNGNDTTENMKLLNNNCQAQIVMEQNSKIVLHSQNANIKMEMASTTKLVTALIAIENLPLDKQVIIPKEAVGIEGSSIYLKQNQKFSVRDLLYGLMLRSGNDSAVALAIATAGNVPNFVNMMNKKALELGLKDTHFENPHGLSNANHYTTAYELAVLASEAMNNETFCTIVASKRYIVQENDTHDTMFFLNKNKMLSSFDGANGIKTGYTTRSGRCLVSSARRNNLQLVCVTLNDYNMWEDSKMLMQKIFDNYVSVNFGDKNNCNWSIPLDSIDSETGKNNSIDISLKNSITFPMRKNQKINFTFKIIIDKILTPTVPKYAKIGKIFIYNDNCLLFEQEIITMKEIKEIGDLRKLSNFVGDLSLENYNGEIKQIFGCKRGIVT